VISSNSSAFGLSFLAFELEWSIKEEWEFEETLEYLK
jgi:hypothetical protein